MFAYIVVANLWDRQTLFQVLSVGAVLSLNDSSITCQNACQKAFISVCSFSEMVILLVPGSFVWTSAAKVKELFHHLNKGWTIRKSGADILSI